MKKYNILRIEIVEPQIIALKWTLEDFIIHALTDALHRGDFAIMDSFDTEEYVLEKKHK